MALWELCAEIYGFPSEITYTDNIDYRNILEFLNLMMFQEPRYLREQLNQERDSLLWKGTTKSQWTLFQARSLSK